MCSDVNGIERSGYNLVSYNSPLLGEATPLCHSATECPRDAAASLRLRVPEGGRSRRGLGRNSSAISLNRASLNLPVGRFTCSTMLICVFFPALPLMCRRSAHSLSVSREGPLPEDS